MGRRPQGLRLGDRDLARSAAGPVLGQRLLEADDQGWYRVPGFWSDRKTDRLDYRKNGPPEERPDDEPGEPPAPTASTSRPVLPRRRRRGLEEGILGQGPARLGVGARAVGPPARRLGLPGRLLGPHPRGSRHALRPGRGCQVRQDQADDLIYQPYTQVSPEMYGQLYGAFGRPNSNYDGYPGVYYDDSGRYYGYANYGNLGGYYGYLDYPYYGGTAIPTMPQPGSAMAMAAMATAVWRLWHLWWPAGRHSDSATAIPTTAYGSGYGYGGFAATAILGYGTAASGSAASAMAASASARVRLIRLRIRFSGSALGSDSRSSASVWVASGLGSAGAGVAGLGTVAGVWGRRLRL